MSETKTPRPNADLMAQFMADDKAKIWWWDRRNQRWISVLSGFLVSQGADHVYVVSRKKPTAPPVIMCELAGVKFPMPLRVAPNVTDKYWALDDFGSPVASLWGGLANELDALDSGFLQATKKGAEQMAVAIKAAIKQAVDEAGERHE